ncbi:MAG: hypothetical protein EOP84_22120 [Verrucomicrobiaceae bacterium]|nr:MAG: hypothetical protein EOP84_22120 [Verrucomicrobiaceae bacterium]
MGSPQVIEVGLPLFFAIFPSITLAGLPDRDADRAAGKRTLAVKFGAPAVVGLASLSALAAWGLAFLWSSNWPLWSLIAALVHASLLIVLAISRAGRKPCSRIDAVILVSLAYVLWFALVPLMFHWP